MPEMRGGLGGKAAGRPILNGLAKPVGFRRLRLAEQSGNPGAAGQPSAGGPLPSRMAASGADPDYAPSGGPAGEPMPVERHQEEPELDPLPEGRGLPREPCRHL